MNDNIGQFTNLEDMIQLHAFLQKKLINLLQQSTMSVLGSEPFLVPIVSMIRLNAASASQIVVFPFTTR